MAEQDTGQERTEQPTPKRLDDARKKGQVLRSREFNTLMSMIGASAAVLFLGAGLGPDMLEGTRQLLHRGARARLSTRRSLSPTWQTRRVMPSLPRCRCSSPCSRCLWSGRPSSAACASAPRRCGSSSSTWIPSRAFKRMFGPNALVEVAKSLLKVAWLGVVAVLVARDMQRRGAGRWPRMPVVAAIEQCMALLAFALLALSLALIPIAAIDVPAPGLAAPVEAAHDAPGGEGRAQGDRRQPGAEGPHPAAAARDVTAADDGGGAARRRGDHEPDALRRGAALRPARRGRADGGGQGCGHVAERIRAVAGEQRCARVRGAAAGARPVLVHRDRRQHPRRASTWPWPGCLPTSTSCAPRPHPYDAPPPPTDLPGAG